MKKPQRRTKLDSPKAEDASATSKPNSRWKEVPVGLLSENIINQVRALLFKGRTRPGDHLGTEASLCKSFGVSRVVIRDALKSLQANGIVESKK